MRKIIYVLAIVLGICAPLIAESDIEITYETEPEYETINIEVNHNIGLPVNKTGNLTRNDTEYILMTFMTMVERTRYEGKLRHWILSIKMREVENLDYLSLPLQFIRTHMII